MLPKIDTPLYEITLPLSKQKIKFRPFLVKEEKILLMAMESEEEEAVILAIKQIGMEIQIEEVMKLGCSQELNNNYNKKFSAFCFEM